MKVLKFGGTSVRSVEKMKKLQDTIGFRNHKLLCYQHYKANQCLV